MSAAATVNRIPGGTAGTVATLDAMHRAILQGQHDPGVLVYAQSVVAAVPEHDTDAEIDAIFRQVREDFRYTRDPVGVELVKTPTRILREIEDRGWAALDCDDASVWLAALLRAVGIETRFRAIRASRARPGEFSHVYVEACGTGGRWIKLDPIAREFGMGEAPAALFGSMAYPRGVGGWRRRRAMREAQKGEAVMYQLAGVGGGAPNPWANATRIASREYGYGGRSAVAESQLAGVGISVKKIQKYTPEILKALGLETTPESTPATWPPPGSTERSPATWPASETPRPGMMKWIVGGALALVAAGVAVKMLRRKNPRRRRGRPATGR